MAPWRVLGVDRRASPEDVKKAFKRLAMEWHPDRRPSREKAVAEAKFKAISEACEVMTRRGRRPRRPPRQLALVAPDSWREKHRVWIQAARGSTEKRFSSRPKSGPGDPLHSKAGDGRVQCPHCSRYFGPMQAERHIPKCQHTVNRPKPPPILEQSSSQGGCSLSPGIAVEIQGLTAATHLNGTRGIILQFDCGSGRWIVRMPGGETKAIRDDNLLQVSRYPSPDSPSRRSREGANAIHSPSAKSPGKPDGGYSYSEGMAVRLHSLKGAAHLNGCIGQLESFDLETQRWRVKIYSGEVKAVRPENMEVPLAHSNSGPRRPPFPSPGSTTGKPWFPR
eukprot:TRINITY_DN81494_c0_g1_i1.p1 TRINITY_DN81494_c0_g1~~TRINITY_DN81494_c0_g1_i1.p1  ORF type:complete len:353 (-),score=47.12 TRINITY_DN81494_c0_g1_i1:40-1047(-)